MKRILVILLIASGLLVVIFFSFRNPANSNAVPQDEFNSYLPATSKNLSQVTIRLASQNIEAGIVQHEGGDVDTEVVLVGNPPIEARRSGNGQVLPSSDGNTTEDFYIRFDVDDNFIYDADPTDRIRIEVEYFDQGTDQFGIQYDAPIINFKDTAPVTKGDTGEFQVAIFYLCAAQFMNETGGGDFRLTDYSDGAEILSHVTVTLLEQGPIARNVDSCGANPWDSLPDSDGIQRCVNLACSGDTILFTSDTGAPGYQGYLIDKTIFLVMTEAKSDLSFTATDPPNRAFLQATDDLKGFVVSATARSQIGNTGEVDDLSLSHLHLDGNRANRVCFGADNIGNGVDDSWGSWLPECPQVDNGLCYPGTLNMCGATDLGDVNQDYLGNPNNWSTGFMVDNVYISNTECATAFGFCAAASTIQNTTIDIAGDHVHGIGCAQTDPDEPMTAWADGITFEGPGHIITGNTVLDASDVGIVFFGGKDTIIANNTIQARPGNYGMFAAIAIHPWGWGDVSGMEITGNMITSTASTSCGGIHAGINIGTHMWGAGCRGSSDVVSVGNPYGSTTECTAEPPPPMGTLCTGGACQLWAHVAAGQTFTLQNNHVTGAHVNYLIEGLDLVGTLVESGNTSTAPQMSDWASSAGCWNGSSDDTWGPLGFVAHHPTVPGWTDQRIHCER